MKWIRVRRVAAGATAFTVLLTLAAAALGATARTSAVASSSAGCATYNPAAARVVPTLPAGLPCPTKGSFHIGLLAVGDCPYCSGLVAAYKQEAALLGVKLDLLDGKLKADVQAQQMTTEISKHPQAIIVVPVDQKAIVPGIAQAKAAGIPVIDATIQIDKSGLKYVEGYVGISDNLAGKECADLLAAQIGKQGNVAIVGGTPGGSTTPRTAGFKAEMAKIAPKVKILDLEYTDFTAQKAQSVAASIITRYGSKLNGIFSEDDTMASGVAQAIANAGKTGKIKLVGMNANRTGITLMKQGKMTGTLLQSPTVDGTWSIIYAVDVLEHHQPGKNVIVPLPVVTKGNFAKFAPGW